MTQGILNERLQEERRHEAIEGRGLDVLLKSEPVTQACLLDFNVALNKLQIFAHADSCLSDWLNASRKSSLKEASTSWAARGSRRSNVATALRALKGSAAGTGPEARATAPWPGATPGKWPAAPVRESGDKSEPHAPGRPVSHKPGRSGNWKIIGIDKTAKSENSKTHHPLRRHETLA